MFDTYNRLVIKFMRGMMFDDVIKTISFLGDLSVTVVTLYTAWLTFGKSISFLSYTKYYDAIKGDSYSVDLQNNSLTAVSISKVHLIFGYSYSLPIKDDDETSITVSGRSVITVRMKNMTGCTGAIDPHSSKVTGVAIEYSSGEIFIANFKYQGIIHWIKQKVRNREYIKFRLRSMEKLMPYRIYCNEKVVSKGVQYMISISVSGKTQEIYVLNEGYLNHPISNGKETIHFIPEEQLINKTVLRTYLNEFYKAAEVNINVYASEIY